MRYPRSILTLLLTLGVTVAASAQSPSPPNQWHPYRGGTNCIQVADRNNNFNCAAGTTVDPTTGNMVISGTISFTSTGGFSATYFPGIVVAAVGSNAQVLGTSDLVIATSPRTTVAPTGPLIKGVVLRVRPSPVVPGYCRVVVSGGNGIGEYTLSLVPSTWFGPANPSLPSQGLQQVTDFPGGPLGC